MSKVTQKGWKTLSQKNLVDNYFVTLTEEEVELPTGQIQTYYVRRRSPFSIIIPKDGDTYYLVRQYRYPADTVSLEFCMGYVANKEPLEIAKQELKEELGIQAQKFTLLGKFLLAPGSSDQEAYVYMAEELTFGEPEPEEGEILEEEKYSFEEIGKLIASGEILDASTIVAYHMLEQYLKT